MIKRIKEAFMEVRDGYSADVVIANPELNGRFLDACRERGLTEPALELNQTLLNARKSSGLRGLARSRKLIVRKQDNYSFASEIAVRFIERRDQVSLDHILCDPDLADQFDNIAASICPGYTPLEYRWAALSLRH
jgi:hypothetical protein